MKCSFGISPSAGSEKVVSRLQQGWHGSATPGLRLQRKRFPVVEEKDWVKPQLLSSLDWQAELEWSAPRTASIKGVISLSTRSLAKWEWNEHPISSLSDAKYGFMSTARKVTEISRRDDKRYTTLRATVRPEAMDRWGVAYIWSAAHATYSQSF